MKENNMRNKILFNGLGNRGWIGGLYYLKNIMFSCLQSEIIRSKYKLVVLIDSEHADIFECYKDEKYQADVEILVYNDENKWKLLAYELKLIWFGGVKYCYALELNRIGRLFVKKGVFWIPDFQHRTLPEFFKEEEIAKKITNDTNMTNLTNTMVLSSNDSKHDLEKFYPEHKCPIEVVHFVSYIEPEIRSITKEFELETKKKFGLGEEYIYFPNQFWKHKNHIVAVQAIEEILCRIDKGQASVMQDYQFVFTGNLEDYRNPEYIDQLKQIMQAPHVAEKIKLLGFVDRREQLSIMKNANFIVQPSLCEGWGTVLEDAKVLDKKVLLSNIPVHEEQKNEKCQLFDPQNPIELADKMIAWANEEKNKPELFAGNVELGICNMYKEAKEYAKALERVFK